MGGFRRIIALVTPALLLAALFPAAGGHASPIPPTPELWLMNADGSDPREIVSDSYATELDWSPDGTRFASVSGSALVVVDASTGAETKLTEPPEYPGEVAWSPDGGSIIYSFSEGDASGMRTVSPDGSDKQTVLTLRSGLLVSGLDWSPDSRYVSFVQGPGDGRPGRVNVLDVTDRSSREVAAMDALYTDTLWSPDGNWIAFSGWQWHLFVVRPDGTDGRDLTPDLQSANDPEWAPDGSEIAFTGYDPSEDHPDPDFFGVMAASPITGESRPIVFGGSAPSWSPDGTRLAYSREGNIYTVDRTGNDARRLTSEELQRDTSPDWSPDGARIAFTRTRVQVLCGGLPYPVEANVIGTPGDDVLNGTPEADVIAGRGGNDTIHGLEGNDLICGDDGDDFVDGGPGDDTIYGNRGADEVRGGSGNDDLDGSEGSDSVDGGEGTDLATFSSGRGGVNVDLELGRAVGHGTDSLTGIENVTGTGKDDMLAGDGARNVLHGAGHFWAHMHDQDVLIGRGGPDSLNGFSGPDRLRGGQGRDRLRGGDGNDDCRGGLGRDSVRGC